MDEMEEKLGSILNNPQMMQQIMSMAQSLNQSQTTQSATQPPPKQDNNSFPAQDIDLSMVQKLSGLAGQSHIDKNQQTLLSALTPYLSRDRITKLEKAMRAAKIAGMATVFLSQGGATLLTGR